MIKAFAFALLYLSATAHAYDFKVGGVYYNFTSDRKGAIVTYSSLDNNAYSGRVVIPTSVTYQFNTLDVKGIGDHAFFNCQTLEEISLPDGITYIEDQAFSHCYALKSITLPSKLNRIGDSAFEYCEDMTSLTIPVSVSQIGYMVFYRCHGLTDILVEDGNAQFCSIDGVLFLADKSILVQYPAAKADKEYTVPEEVVTVTDYAFNSVRNLEKLSIGRNVSTISPATFEGCTALREFEVDAASPTLCAVDGVLFDKDAATLLQYPLGSETTDYALPGTVTRIADMAMMGAEGLAAVKFPASLTAIGEAALSGCTNLKSITSFSATPPTTGSIYSPFDASLYASATLFVNKEDIDAYRNDAIWGRFVSIKAYGESGIADTTAAASSKSWTIAGLAVFSSDGSPVTVYDMAGNLVASGCGKAEVGGHGLYVVVVGGSAEKVMF